MCVCFYSVLHGFKVISNTKISNVDLTASKIWPGKFFVGKRDTKEPVLG